MKKSTLLSLLTAGAVIATSAGTFAAWDSTTASIASNEISFRKGVSTTIAPINLTSENENKLETPVYTANPTITVNDVPSGVDFSNYQVTLKAYAFDTKVNADAAVASNAPESFSTGKLDTVTVVINETMDFPSDSNSVQPTITVTPNDSLNTGTNKASIVVVATLQEKTSV